MCDISGPQYMVKPDILSQPTIAEGISNNVYDAYICILKNLRAKIMVKQKIICRRIFMLQFMMIFVEILDRC